MKIIPLCTNDLRNIIDRKITYSKLYTHFNNAYNAAEIHPLKWYENYVSIDNYNPYNIGVDETLIDIAAEPSPETS